MLDGAAGTDSRAASQLRAHLQSRRRRIQPHSWSRQRTSRCPRSCQGAGADSGKGTAGAANLQVSAQMQRRRQRQRHSQCQQQQVQHVRPKERASSSGDQSILICPNYLVGIHCRLPRCQFNGLHKLRRLHSMHVSRTWWLAVVSVVPAACPASGLV